MKAPDPFKWLKRRRQIKLDLRCTACGHTFQRRVARVFVDMDMMAKNRGQGAAQKRSEYVIPERIMCPGCQVVDQFELEPSSRIKIQSALLMSIVVKPDPDDPIQAIRFALSDGTPMHPLDALEMYAKHVASQPDRTDVRVRYANTLRSLGYYEEAEAQYRAALERDATEIEALINIAAFHAGRGEKQAAYDYLKRAIACAPESRHPQRSEFAGMARLVLEGKLKLDDLKVKAPEQPVAPPPLRPGPPPRPTPAGRRKKKKRRSR